MNNDLQVHVGGRKSVAVNSILMLKANINYTLIFLDDGSQILSSTTIGILEKRLKDYQFFRPNRSTIINLEFMADFEKKSQVGSYSRIVLKNNEEVLISRRRTMKFLRVMQ